MATYVVLISFTDEGRRNATDLRGLDAAKQGVEALGARWKAWYMTMGQYDGVLILEAPDDETVARIALAQAMRGVAKSETLRAFSEGEVRQLVAALQGTP